MRRQTNKSLTLRSITFILAMLLALSSWAPVSGRAEAQMRCAGASPYSAPCARMALPAAGLSEAQAYSKLLPCCRAMRAVAMHCSRLQSVQPLPASGTQARRSSLSARRCFVTLHVLAAGAAAPAVSHTRWLLTANPALAPPVAARAAFTPAVFTRLAFRAFASTLSPHILPRLHGLRAPPAA